MFRGVFIYIKPRFIVGQLFVVFRMPINFRKKEWRKERIEQGITWTGALKLGLINPRLKKAINNPIKIPRIKIPSPKMLK